MIKAPFPYFGGKSRVADVVWQRLGDVPNYGGPMRNEAWNYLYLHQRIAKLLKYIFIEQWPFWVWFAFIWAVALSEAWSESQ